jgi:hypothetical protein
MGCKNSGVRSSSLPSRPLRFFRNARAVFKRPIRARLVQGYRHPRGTRASLPTPVREMVSRLTFMTGVANHKSKPGAPLPDQFPNIDLVSPLSNIVMCLEAELDGIKFENSHESCLVGFRTQPVATSSCSLYPTLIAYRVDRTNLRAPTYARIRGSFGLDLAIWVCLHLPLIPN